MQNPFPKIGACLCALLGALYCVLVTKAMLERAFLSWIHAVVVAIYTLLAFVPFIIFIFPGLKVPRRSVIFSGIAVEILVLGLLLVNLFTD
jgi:integral membrane sensor domain MASE1